MHTLDVIAVYTKDSVTFGTYIHSTSKPWKIYDIKIKIPTLGDGGM